jgi:hypothetical protein
MASRSGLRGLIGERCQLVNDAPQKYAYIKATGHCIPVFTFNTCFLAALIDGIASFVQVCRGD